VENSAEIQNLSMSNCMAIVAKDSPHIHWKGGCASFKHENSMSKLTNVIFHRCRANSAGAVVIHAKTSLDFRNVSFSQCSAHNGAAVKVEGALRWADGSIGNSFALGDNEGRWGGALRLQGVISQTSLHGLHFINDYTAKGFGAAIFSNHPINVTVCTFSNNNGPAGVSDIFYTTKSPGESKLLLLANNRFDRAGGVVVGLPRSCADEAAADGVTTIYPLGKPPLEVRCDLSSEGAPWTTF
jgi:hypothetical protein